MLERFVDRTAARERIGKLTVRSFFNVRVLGYALQRAWVFLLFLGVATSSLTSTGEHMPGITFVISSIVLCLTLFAAAMREDLFVRVLVGPGRRWLGPVLTALGTICGFLIFWPGIPDGLMAVLCGLLTGVGSAFIDLGWGEVYRNVNPEITGIEIPFSTFLAAIIYAIGMVVSLAVAFLITMLLPLASGFILLHTLHIGDPTYTTTVKPVSINIAKFTWRIGVCACLIGAADSVIRLLFIHLNGVPMDAFYRTGMLAGTGIAAVIFIGHQLFARDVNYREMYKFVVFLMAFFFLLLPVFTGQHAVESVVALLSYNAFNVLIWILLATLCYTYRLSTLTVFGIGWGMVTLGVTIGQIFGGWLVNAVEFTPQLTSLVVLVCTLAVLGSDMFVLREDDIIDLTKIDDEVTADEAEAKDTGAAEKDSRLPVSTPFKNRCREVAEEHGLTPRETEVMILFAKGRSSARIQEDLVLSRGTVTTHLQHIYQKCDVHSKQELLDLIERR